MTDDQLFHGVLAVVDGDAARDVDIGDALAERLGGFEVRGDLFADVGAALDLVARLRGGPPVLFTLRSTREGGRWPGDEDRVPILRRALEAGARAVDAEHGTRAARELAAIEAPLVLSHHDFDRMPDRGELERLTAEMEAASPRVVKVVPTARRLEDGLAMLEWVGRASPNGPARVGFAMGEKGLPSRILSIARGAPFTYASLGASVAPGQPSASRLIETFRATRTGPATVVLGVVGRPVGHSLSPDLHNPSLDAAGIDAVYLPLLADDLTEIEPLWRGLGLRGLSVTIPHKEEAARRADEIDDRARRAGAANTLVLLDPGGAGRARVAAYNTDVDGVLGPLRRRRPRLSELRVAIVGNGGAARGAAAALVEAGAEVSLVARSAERGARVAAELGVASVPLDGFDGAGVDVIINATPLGLAPDDPSPVEPECFRPGQIAFDMVYDPPETAFLRDAAAAGAETIPGGEMLVEQGLVQFRLFTGHEARRADFAAALAKALRARGAGGR